MNRSDLKLTISASLAAFGAYFCMYAFRKPFTATTYEAAASFGALDFKIGLVIAQVLGYALSKFIGIKVISEMKPKWRTALFIGLIAFSELALIGFGLVKDHWSSLLMLFLNGLPLGMIWGIVFSYLEGRRTTEILGAILASSFIVSSGAVKNVGAWLLTNDWARSFLPNEYWMPAMTGALFFIPLVGFAFWLRTLPPPNEADQLARTKREPMDAQQRKQLLSHLGLGLIGIVAYYVLVTAFRDVRDNFAAELWTALGYGDTPAIFTLAELPIALLTLLPLLIGYFIKSNEKALRYYHALILFSTILFIIPTWLFTNGMLDGAYWIIAVGLGLYLGYVPLNAIYFDRLVGAFKQVATAGFLIYVADASGYAGSVAVLLWKNFGSADLSWLDFFINLAYIAGGLGFVIAAFSWYAFERRLIYHQQKSLD